MYLKRNAELVCEVRGQGGAAVEVKWYNESGGQLYTKQANGNSNTYTATATVTYDEWSKGMNWYCEASIEGSIENPTRKSFVKNNSEYMFSDNKTKPQF